MTPIHDGWMTKRETPLSEDRTWNAYVVCEFCDS